MMLASTWYNAGAVFTKLVASLYRTVASTYNLMNDFIEGFKDADIVNSLSAIEENVYILVAVFMLFRITISLLEYLIDPDKSSDKNVGAGKLITRIIVSLLLVIAAQGFLFDWADELESALLADDSILFNLFQLSDEGIVGDGSSSAQCDIKGNYQKGNITSMEELHNSIKGCNVGSSLKEEIKYVAKKISGKNYNVLTIGTEDYKEWHDFLPGIDEDVAEYIFESIQNGTLKRNSVLASRSTALLNYIIITGDPAVANVEYDIKDTPGAFFARSVVSSFSNNPSVIKNPTESGEYFLDNSDADDDIAKMVEHDEIQLDAFICLICGIVMIVLILILCIEVIIRELKLVVLEVFAPIAFISYMNPNDKVLGNWFQKYIGCYLDLFLKLLAIRIGIFLISVVIDAELQFGAIGTILFYIGIFIFIKTLPNLVSDILGIKNMGGTFKESMKGLKTAAGIGAGAIAGGVAGFASGFGKGGTFSTVAGGLLGGTFRGAQGGMKGKVFQGASTQIKRNSTVKNARLDGSHWWDRQRANMGFNVTADDDRKIAEHEKRAKQHSAAVDYASKAKKYVSDELENGKGNSLVGSKYASIYTAERDKISDLKKVEDKIRTDKSGFIDTQAKAQAYAAYEAKASEIAEVQRRRDEAASVRDAKIQSFKNELNELDRARHVDRSNFPSGYYGDNKYKNELEAKNRAYEAKAAEFTKFEQDTYNEFNSTINNLDSTESILRAELLDLDAKRNQDFYDEAAHQQAIAEAEANTKAQHDKVYGKGGIKDLAIEEYYNVKVDSDEDLQSMAMDFQATQHVSDVDLSDVDVHDWATVKKGKDTHTLEAARERQQATELKESEKYQGEKASKDQAKK